MLRFSVFSFILVVSIFSVQAKSECDISGVWNHSAKPAELLIDLNKSEITVYSHDNNKKSTWVSCFKGLKTNIKCYAVDRTGCIVRQTIRLLMYRWSQKAAVN